MDTQKTATPEQLRHWYLDHVGGQNRLCVYVSVGANLATLEDAFIADKKDVMQDAIAFTIERGQRVQKVVLHMNSIVATAPQLGGESFRDIFTLRNPTQ